MKKLILILILSLSLTSCFNDNDKKNSENTGTNSNQAGNVDKQNQVLNKTYLEEKKNELDSFLEEQKTYSRADRANMNCEERYVVYENLSKEEQKLYSDAQKKCVDIRAKAKKESDKIVSERIDAVKTFDISKCASIAKEKYAGMKEDKNMPGGMNVADMIKNEQSYCEMAYAFQYGCDKLTDQAKKKSCIDLKDFQQKQAELERYQSFVLGTYLK